MSSSKTLPLLSKLQLHGTVWIAADIHLGPHSPKTSQAFYQFLDQAKQHADALILCGDIFHAWVGADQAIDPPAWLAHAVYHFRRTAMDLPIFFMRGNRDFLLDGHFAHYVGAQMLDDQLILQTDHHRLLLTHGDELCTDDQRYQRFRRRVRNKKLQRFFLRLPLAWRERIAGGLRQQSQKQQQYLPQSITDVNEQACMDLLQQHHEQVLVHGHTHRPALHRLENGFSRIVLPDWEYDHSEPSRSGWITLEADGQIAFHRLHHPTLRFKLKK